MRRNRKQLPLFGKLPYSFDLEKLQTAFRDFKNYQLYTDLEASNENCTFGSLCLSRSSLHKKFLSVEEQMVAEKTGLVSSQQYRQLALTEFCGGQMDVPEHSFHKNFLTYRRSSLPNSKKYVSSFDERNFTKRKNICRGFWNEVLDTFKSQVTRTRFAYLGPRGKIQPHVDYDTTYSIRVHIPLVTNPKSYMFVKDRDGTIQKKHLPADGGVYFMNTGLQHWVENGGNSERVHLIISIDGQEDLKGMYELID